MQFNTKDIYEQMKHLESDIDIQDIHEIKRLIEKCEDAISCIINQPEKLNPTQLIISQLIDVLKNKNNSLRKSQIASIVSIIEFIIS